MKNLTLAYCIRILKKLDPEMAEYLSQYKEEQLNMSTVSAYVRELRAQCTVQSTD